MSRARSSLLVLIALTSALAGCSSLSPPRSFEPLPLTGVWSIMSEPDLATAANSIFFGVTAVTDRDVWAVGSIVAGNGAMAQALIEHWDGSAWRMTPAPRLGTSVLVGVAALSSQDAWAVGSGASSPSASTQGLIEHWDGHAWSIVAGPALPGAALDGVSAASASDVWAVGSANDGHSGASFPEQALIERWNGARWSVVPNPAPFGSDLSAVVAISTTDAWAVGSQSAPSSAALVTLVEHWNGAIWSIVPTASSGALLNQLNAVAALASGVVWAVGYESASSQESALAEDWNGHGWLDNSPNLGQAGSEFEGVITVGSAIWAVGMISSPGGDTRTLIARSDGTGWSVAPSPDVPAGVNDLKSIAASSGYLWAAGYASNGTSSQALVMRYH